MKSIHCTITALTLLTVTGPQTPAQSTYEAYTFTTLAGGGGFSTNQAGSAARFWFPISVAVDSAGNVYVADSVNHSISKVTPAGAVTTLAGQARIRGSADGTGSTARFFQPFGLSVDHAGNVYVADTFNNLMRRMTLDGTNWLVTTVAGVAGSPGSANGTNSDARFNYPVGVAVDSANNVYVADHANGTIRKMTQAGTNWAVTTLAGIGGIYGSAEGTGPDARFNGPSGVALDRAKNAYVADTWNGTIRKGYPPPRILNAGFNLGQLSFNLTGPAGYVVTVVTQGGSA